MLPCNDPDRIPVAFDDPRLVVNAGLMLPVTLAHRLGLSELAERHLDLGDCIDDTDALRTVRLNNRTATMCCDQDAANRSVTGRESDPGRPLPTCDRSVRWS